MKILNFGSLNIDLVYSLDHIVLEGETISSHSLEKFCGGKGLNQSIALARAGAAVYHAGRIGQDGKMLKDYLEQNGVDVSLVEYSAVNTGNAIIQLDKKGQNSIILYGGANREIDESYAARVLAHFNSGDILLVQNEISCMKYIMEEAYKKGMRIALNPSPMDETILELPLHHVEWFILNEIEGCGISKKTEANDMMDEILKKYPQSKVVLTLGKDGVVYKDKNCELKHGIYKVEVVDTTAAGDTFTGYFLAAVLQGLELSEALKNASLAASLAVSKKGASISIPTIKEVKNSHLLQVL